MGYQLGVDLGTTFVAAAIANDSRVEMFTLGDRTVVTPSVVFLGEDGSIVTGEAAGRRAVSSPQRVGREFKRRLGDPTPVMLGGTSYSVTMLLGALLHDVVNRITEAEGAKPDSVLLTHPANWGPFRRELFEEVPQIAGLTSTWTVTEPEAAAAHYAASRRLNDGEIIAVYDLGGGTFDATVLRKAPEGIEILGAPEGIERLGGVDFDEAILTYVNYCSGGALSELDMGDPQTAVAMARLRQDCVLAKESLSVDTETAIPVFLPNRHFDVTLNRSDFQDMIRAPIESTIGTLVRTLRSANVSLTQLSAVLLVGGSSRIPLVADMISQELGRPTVVDSHPKYAVALGAATLARARAAGGTWAETAAAVETERSAARSTPTPMPALARVEKAPTPPDDQSGLRSAPKPQPEPGQSPRHAGPGFGGLSRPTPLVAVAAVIALAVLGTGSYFAWNALNRAEVIIGVASPARTGGGSAAPAPTGGGLAAPASVSPSVPVPSLGPTIPLGATPGFITISPNGRQAYIANRNAGIITVLDTAVNKVTATIPVPTGPPQYLAFSPDGRTVYVSIFNDAATVAAVGVLDTTTNTIVATIPVRTRPFLAAVTPDGKRLYVPNHDSGTVSVIDTATNKLAAEIKVAPNPHWVAFSSDGTRAYTANHESNLISVIDTATNAVIGQVPVQASPHSVAVNPARPLVANVNYDANSVTMIDEATAKVVGTIPVGKNPQQIVWAPDGRFAYVTNVTDNTVSVINVQTMAVTATLPTGGAPTSIAVLPNGKEAFVTNLNDGTLTVLNTAA